MWPEIYNFFEQFAGVSYDFVEDIDVIIGDTVFIDPTRWNNTVSRILDNLEDALDCIEEYGHFLGEDMPSKNDLKKFVASYVLGELVSNINSIKRKLNIETEDISNFDELEQQLYTIGQLVEMLKSNSLDEILEKDLFNTYLVEDDDEDNPFVTVLGLHENDVTNLSFTVTAIRDDYFAQLDEDES